MNALLLAVVLSASAPGPFAWEPWKDGSEWQTLWEGGVCVGWYNVKSGRYFEWAGSDDKLGPEAKCPTAPPVRNFGLDTGKISRTPRYTRAGKVVTRDEVIQALEGPAGGGDVPEPPKYWVTVIGPQGDRERVAAQIASSGVLTAKDAKAALNAYGPDHWAVAQVGFRTDGKPTVYVQDDKGNVLHRQDDDKDVGKGVMEALRQADPKYDPAKDPDRRNPIGPGGVDWAKVQWEKVLPWALFAVVVVLIWKGGK